MMTMGNAPATAPRRVLVKLSGEMLGGASGVGVCGAALRRIAAEVVEASAGRVELAVVVGGGNLVRGATLQGAGVDRTTADQMGMLATTMNALALRDALEAQGHAVAAFNAVAVPAVMAGYSAAEVRAALAAGVITLLAGGTGNTRFTTDTGACLRAIEVGADLMVKGTKVDGVFNADPATHPDAERYETLTFEDVLRRRLAVMDRAAAALCEEHRLPVVVCDLGEPGALTRAVRGAKVGTRIEWTGDP